MEELTQYLNQILDWHTKLGSPLAKYLLPGLSKSEIRKKVAALPFAMPDEFIELYTWRNGTPARDPNWVSFIEYHRFLSLDEALDVFQMTYPITKQFYEKTDWIMTFEDGSGDGYGISAVEEVNPITPIVFLFEGEGVNVVSESLTQMMRTMVASFEAGVFKMGKDGDLETDFIGLGEIAHKLNPDIYFWTRYVSYSGFH
ncbi:MAG TPA: SMI1/KNR4 family protein [Longilinea sp.]|nr:SMI1/KNR4 family protein [Longilinea sp.]